MNQKYLNESFRRLAKFVWVIILLYVLGWTLFLTILWNIFDLMIIISLLYILLLMIAMWEILSFSYYMFKANSREAKYEIR